MLAAMGLIVQPAVTRAEETPVAAALSATQIALPLTINSATGPRLSGAWQLTMDDARFGGFSSMMLVDDDLMLLSDAGVMFRLHRDGDGFAPSALASALPAACTTGPTRKDSDSESMSVTPDGREVRIGMERSNTLCAVDLDSPQGARSLNLAPMALWPQNAGAEAMASLSNKGLAIIGETRDAAEGTHPLLWYHGDPADADVRLTNMRYQPPRGYKPADAAFLPDGRMIIINRRFRIDAGRATALSIVPAFTPTEGQVLTGDTITEIANQPLAANYEGIAIAPRAGGHTIWMVSDDNFSKPGRTMLLRMELDDVSPVDATTLTAQGSSLAPATRTAAAR